jgi:hypothetical protein
MTIHYISQTVPGAGQIRLTVQGAGGTGNINDGILTSSSPSTDAIGVWWTDTGVLATRTTKKQLLMALKDIVKFIERGGYRTSGAASQDVHVPT